MPNGDALIPLVGSKQHNKKPKPSKYQSVRWVTLNPVTAKILGSVFSMSSRRVIVMNVNGSVLIELCERSTQ